MSLLKPLNQPLLAEDWKGLRVWVLGASGAIGTALAVAMAKRGARLVLSGRRADALAETASLCHLPLSNSSAITLPLDITDTAAIETAVEQIKTQMGGVDLIVINAGTYQATRAHELMPERINQVLETNLIGPMRATPALLASLLATATDPEQKQRPRGIAFVGSVAGYRGLPRSLTYGPSKAGLISFAESLWQDLNPLGLNVWLINPGFVRSRLTAQNDFEMPALIDADTAAEAILSGFSRGQFEIHFPKRFTCFMKLLQLLPIGWYLRLSKRLVLPLERSAFHRTKQHEGATP